MGAGGGVWACSWTAVGCCRTAMAPKSGTASRSEQAPPRKKALRMRVRRKKMRVVRMKYLQLRRARGRRRRQ
ncbi:hypothetical protein D3C85_1343610 [compost metagenome]